jgi:hypothetical protein
VWTVKHGDGWANRREGARRASKVFVTKDDAQRAGRITAQRERVEHIIADADGGISERNSYGGDPRSRRG